MPRHLLPLLLAASLTAALPGPASAQKAGGTAAARPTKRPPSPPARPPAPAPTGEALIEALENEDAARALALVQRGADPNALTAGNGASALSLAASLGDVKLVRALLDRKAAVNPEDPDTAVPLTTALTYGHAEVARLLVEKAAAVNVGDGGSFSRRPLVLAAALGSVPLVTLLLDKGAELNHVADDGVTAFATAAGNGHVPVLELLVARGAKVKEDAVALNAALRGGSVPAVRFLLSQGRTLSERPPGTTLLHQAAAGGNPELVRMVLDAGAPVDATDDAGETPLMDAARGHHTEAVRLLLDRKARVDMVSANYETALEIAREGSALEEDAAQAARRKATIAVLEKAGAKPAPPSLWRAAFRGETAPLKALLEKGADPNEPDAHKVVPLYYALTEHLSSRSLPLVSALLAKGANPNAKAPDGRSLVTVARDEHNDEALTLLRRAGAETPELELTEAMERGDAAATEALLSKGVVPEPDALVYAMARKDRALLLRLLERGAKVNGRTRIRGFLFSGAPESALHAAASIGDVESARILLDHGADPNLRREEDSPTPLHKVSAEDPEAVDALVRLLVERGADVRARSSGGILGGSVLAQLAFSAPAKTLEFVLSRGALADINVPAGEDAPSPLALAVRAGKAENVRLLLDRGANANPPIRFPNETPLMDVAASDGKPEYVTIAKLLLGHGARTDVKDSIGRTVLQIAEDRRNAEIARLIRAAGGKSGIAPGAEMMRAIQRYDLPTVERFLREGMDPNGKLLGGPIPLYEAAAQGADDIVRLLLQRGADVNATGQLGTALHAAADAGDEDMVRFLLAKGAKVDADHILGTPLARAAEEGHVEVMRLLLKAGADPNARKSERPGQPLVEALKKGGNEAVELLLKAGADPNLGDALFGLVLFGDLERVERLVRAGARVNQQNFQGRTLLMEAAAMGQKDMVAWLIAHKADVNLKDKRGRTALMDAEERDKVECVRLLRKAGAK